MFDQDDLDRLVRAMRENGVTHLSLQSGKDRLKMSLPARQAPAAPVPAPVLAQRVLKAVSPGIGWFLPRGIDDGLAPLGAGAAVCGGEPLGYLCTGPLRALIVAPEAGLVVGEPPASETLLGYGDTVFELEATE